MVRCVWAGLLALAVAVLAAGEVEAQERRRGQPQVIRLDEFHIEGTVQKPNAFLILTRSNLGYEVLDLRTSFVREVLRSIQREPF